MVKVITYGTYDFLHYGHINLLKRAKALGDYLVVGVTSDDYDKERGKINVQQSLMERIEAVKATGIADEIIVEEYEGQKIDDIRKYDIDIFTVGSDWKGKFDYLEEYCDVVYLERTKGVSSSDIRSDMSNIRMGMIGDSKFLNKIYIESEYVNGIQVVGLCTQSLAIMSDEVKNVEIISDEYEKMLSEVDAVYIRSLPQQHFDQIKMALSNGKHVLCESPITYSRRQTEYLYNLALEKDVIFMEGLKTAYATAFSRMLLLVKAGKIGDVVSVDATCTSLKNYNGVIRTDWNGMYEWGPTALLPVFKLLGTEYNDMRIVTRLDNQMLDEFTKIDFVYPNAVASIKVGDGVKSEGELIVSGTDGYIYVPAPWWKTDYFEIRNENPMNNKRYFYQLEGEGIRYELVAFARAIERGKLVSNIGSDVTFKISEVMERFQNRDNIVII